MAKLLPSVKIGPMTGGINRFVNEARPSQCVDALNVYEKEGDLCRRPSFQPIAAAAPYHLPAGSVHVFVEDLPNNFTSYPNRNPAIAPDEFGGNNGRLWIGCVYPFDGIDWSILDATVTTAFNNARVKPLYRNTGGTLVPIYGSVDTTSARVDLTSTTSCRQTLMKEGRISWDRNAFTNWTATTISSVTRYWVALDIVTSVMLPGETVPTSIDFPSENDTFVIVARGLRCFLLNPINGLFSLHTKGNARVVVVGSDFASKRGNVPGGGLGYIRGTYEQTEIARLVEDEGSATCDAVEGNAWNAVAGAATWVDGTAGQIIKNRRDYDWLPSGTPNTGQFMGAPIVNVDPTGASSIAIPVVTGWEGNHARNFENHRARIAVQPGPLGPPVGETREIWRSDSTPNLIEIYPNWTAVLNGNETIEIKRPPSFVQTREAGRDYEISSNTEDALVVDSTQPYQNDFHTEDFERHVNFEIGKACYWAFKPGLRWCACYDSVQGKLILTNGETGLLEFDGIRTRQLEALWDNTEGRPGAATVDLWRGIIRDLAVENNDPNLEAGSQLRHSPPNGKYVVDFSGRLVVANIREREQSLMWTAPGGLNNIWPLGYETKIRDSENNPITGMATLDQSLVVFTKTSIFMGAQPNERGEIFFRPASQGIGFTAHDAVAKVVISGNGVLIGPAADGIYLFNGSEPTVLLDDWRRVLKNGVNKNLLERCCGAAWPAENLYFLAVPSAGSEELDRIIVVDYSRAPESQIWVWSAPLSKTTAAATKEVYDAITAIALDIDHNGNQRILFGHRSGHVSALQEALYDGWGAPVTGYARSKPISTEGVTAVFSKIMATMKALGSTQTVTFRGRVDRHDRKILDFSRTLPSVDTDAIYGTSSYNSSSALYASTPYRTYPINIPHGARGEQFDLEISSAALWRLQDVSVLFSPKGQKSQ